MTVMYGEVFNKYYAIDFAIFLISEKLPTHFVGRNNCNSDQECHNFKAIFLEFSIVEMRRNTITTDNGQDY